MRAYGNAGIKSAAVWINDFTCRAGGIGPALGEWLLTAPRTTIAWYRGGAVAPSAGLGRVELVCQPQSMQENAELSHGAPPPHPKGTSDAAT